MQLPDAELLVFAHNNLVARRNNLAILLGRSDAVLHEHRASHGDKQTYRAMLSTLHPSDASLAILSNTNAAYREMKAKTQTNKNGRARTPVVRRILPRSDRTSTVAQTANTKHANNVSLSGGTLPC